LKLKADGLIKEADTLILEAEEIEKLAHKEDFSQAAGHIVRKRRNTTSYLISFPMPSSNRTA